jgi:CheY-like chemotaxis protein
MGLVACDGAAGDRPTILVVEDDATIRDLIRTVLARFDARLMLAGSAEEAAAAAAAEPHIDLLLTDVLLPGASGRELATTLRGTHPALRVIYITGWRENTALDGIPDAMILSKPFELKELARVVASALGRDGEA